MNSSSTLKIPALRALIVPPKDCDEARAAAAGNVLIIEADIDGDGQVRFSSAAAGAPRATEYPQPDDNRVDPAHQWTTSRPKRVPLRTRT